MFWRALFSSIPDSRIRQSTQIAQLTRFSRRRGVVLGGAVCPIALAIMSSKANKWGCIAGA